MEAENFMTCILQAGVPGELVVRFQPESEGLRTSRPVVYSKGRRPVVYSKGKRGPMFSSGSQVEEEWILPFSILPFCSGLP